MPEVSEKAAKLRLSTVLGSYNRLRYLKLTIESLRRELERCGYTHEIIVVDGGSCDGSVEWLARQKDIVTVIQHNRGHWRGRAIERRSWGYFMNLGFRLAQGEYICMLSDDCLVVPGALKNGVELADARRAAGEKIGAVAFYWRNWPEQERYWIGFTFGNRMFVNHGLYLRQALEEVRYADEDNYFFYHADGDICLRMAERGYDCVDSPHSFIEHFAHANEPVRVGNLARHEEDWARHTATWGHLGKPDSDWQERSFSDPADTAREFRKRWWRWWPR